MRGYEAGQFAPFDGLDNRKTLMDLIKRIGHDLPEMQAATKRAEFLQRVLKLSTNRFAQANMKVEPCSVIEAYFLLTAITGCLGVPVEMAAIQLEEEVR